jgi:hypothetical protein
MRSLVRFIPWLERFEPTLERLIPNWFTTSPYIVHIRVISEYRSTTGGSPVKGLPLGMGGDRTEGLTHWILGLAVVASLGMFFVTLMLVTAESDRIVRALEKVPGGATGDMLASGATNAAPSRSGSTSVAPESPGVAAPEGAKLLGAGQVSGGRVICKGELRWRLTALPVGRAGRRGSRPS